MPRKSESGSPLSAKKLDRSKLRNSSEELEVESGGGSLRAIVLLIIIIVVVAFGGAYLIRNIQQQTTDDSATDSPIDSSATTGEDVNLDLDTTGSDDDDAMDTSLANDGGIIRMDTIIQDSLDENPADSDQFIDDDVNLAHTEDMNYTLDSITGQPFESYYRLTFDFTAEQPGAVNLVPSTTGDFIKTQQELELTFENTEDETGIDLGDEILLPGFAVESVEKSALSTSDTVSYILKLRDEDATFVIRDGTGSIIVDVTGESEEMVLDSDDSSESDDIDDSASADNDEDDSSSDDDDSNTGSQVTTSDSKNITSDIEGNDAAISGFTFGDSTDAFIYELKLADDNVPNISSQIEESGDEIELVIEIDNLRFDALPVDGIGYRDFRPQGVINVEELNISRTGNVSTYRFKLTEKTDYSISIVPASESDDPEDRIIIEIEH